MSIDHAALEPVSGEARQMLTGLEAAPLAEPFLPDGHAVALGGSVVSVTGAWTAEVCVFCTPELATQVAAAMFMMEPAEMTDTDVEDALGELCNVTARGIQARVPGPTDLTVPEHRASVVQIGGAPHWRVDLQVDGEPVVKNVHEQDV